LSEVKDIQKRKIRIIVDTNLFISFAITKNFSFINDLLLEDNLDLIVCDELIAEIKEVSSRPKFNNQISNSELTVLFHLIAEAAVNIKLKSEVFISRDVKDNFLLALAKDSNADFLLTGDKDLLSLHKFENTFIVKMSEFRQLVKDLLTL
jgi:putative PIN family toxin of toxin-antitoxin system